MAKTNVAKNKKMCESCIGFGKHRRSNGYGQGYTFDKCKTCKGTGYVPDKKEKTK